MYSFRIHNFLLIHIVCVVLMVRKGKALTNQSSKKPHILLIVADDLGYNDVGYHNSEIKTPTIDELAMSGVRLENYYVQPICTPTRSQLLSGRYQIHTGLQHGVIRPGQPNGLPLENPTIADKLKSVGYSTHMVGKWHLGFYKKEYLPTYRGFDSFYGYLNGAEDYYKHHVCYKQTCGYDLRDNLDPVTNANGTYSTLLFANRTIDIINKHEQEKPLFLYIPFQAVHGPLQVPERYIRPHNGTSKEIEERSNYTGMVLCMDEAIKNITEALKTKGLWDNTILIFTTDNGGDFRKGGNNFPLRGRKSTVWEGGIRAVGFVSGPLLEENIRGTLSRGMIDVADWFPTIMRIAGGDLDGTLSLDGFDQWDTINGSPSPRTEILHALDPLFPVTGTSKEGSPFDTRLRAALRVGDWKIITGAQGWAQWVPPPSQGPWIPSPDPDNKNVWLFNITADPTEHHDLSQQYPDVVDSMLEKLKAYQDTAVPCRFPETDKRANPALLGGFWGPWQ